MWLPQHPTSLSHCCSLGFSLTSSYWRAPEFSPWTSSLFLLDVLLCWSLSVSSLQIQICTVNFIFLQLRPLPTPDSFNCLLNTFTQMSNRHLKFNMSITELLIFPSHSDPICQPILSTKPSKYIQILTISLYLLHYHSGLSHHHFPLGLPQQSPERFPCFCFWFLIDSSRNSSHSNSVKLKPGSLMSSLHQQFSDLTSSYSPLLILFQPGWSMCCPQTCKPCFHFTTFALAIHSVR